MKKNISLILAFVLIFGVFFGTQISANSFTISAKAIDAIGYCGEDLTWVLDDGVLTISGTGDMFDYKYNSTLPWSKYKNDVTSLVIEDGVTSIGDYTFEGLTQVTSVKIPDSVRRIGAWAFDFCYSLQKVELPENLEFIGEMAFAECSELVSIVIPESVKTIGYGAFEYCGKLSEITLPDSMINFDSNPFRGTAYYKDKSNWESGVLYIGKHLLEIDDNINADCVIKYGTINILPFAFSDVRKLKSVTIPDTVEYIGGCAFKECINLEAVVIPDSVKKLGRYAFYCCDNLKIAVIGNQVSHIGEETFGWCHRLEIVYLSNSVKTIDQSAFYCDNLKYVFYDGTAKEWANINIADGNYGLSRATRYYKCDTPKLTSISNQPTGIKISWSAVSGAENYRVYRRQSATDKWERIAIVNSTSYIDTNVKNNSTWSYTVIAVNKVGLSGFDSKGKSIKFVDTPKLTGITNITTGIKLTWQSVSESDGYNVYRRGLNSKTWSYVGTVKTNFYIDQNVTNNSYWKYTVRATNDGALSGFDTNGKAITFVSAPKISGTSNSPNGIYMKWNAVPGAMSYRVYRRGLNYNSWYYLGSTKNTWYTDTKIKNANGYYYKYTVIAVNNGASGFYDGTYMKRLSNPVLESAVSTKTGVSVKWDSVFGSTGYYVYRKTANSGWSLIGSVKGTDNTTYLDKTAKKGVTYTYTVRAYYGKTLSYYNSGVSCTDKY